jgi:uncharacterized protein (UPF0261 family)
LQQGRPVVGDEGTLQIGASMLGLTQGCVLGAKAILEGGKHELLVFHSNDIGGAALENLITMDAVDAVLDLTTNEVANNVLGGAFDAGPDRLEAAAVKGIPQVIVPGAVDFQLLGKIGSQQLPGPAVHLLHRPEHADAHDAGGEPQTRAPLCGETEP